MQFLLAATNFQAPAIQVINVNFMSTIFAAPGFERDVQAALNDRKYMSYKVAMFAEESPPFVNGLRVQPILC